MSPNMARFSSLPLSLLSYLAIVAPVTASEGPISTTWSSSTFGPDGPWNAIELIFGGEQKVAVYPGHEFQTMLLTPDYCNYNSSIPCYASQAGFYNKDEASVQQTGSSGDIEWQPSSNYMGGVLIEGEASTMWIDSVDLQTGAIIENTSMALVGEAFMTYPNDNWFPLNVGCMGIGAPKTVNQTFGDLGNGIPNINASLIPGYLWATNQTNSNSFGMHIGAANPPMGGSLYFGGYDQNRLIGDVLTTQGDYTKLITLKDISMNVIDGASPFSFDSSVSGLLSSGNSSITSAGLQVQVDGCSPYLTLPTSTCKAIASYLPVSYNADLGLWIWNTTDAQYSKIVSSASALNFTFLGSSNTDVVSISVPFRHLNLTLEAPLVSETQAYFPCYDGPANHFTLGRAFLQDAFVGANWGANTWWLGQAPGPNIPSSSIVTLQDGDTTLQSSTNDWKESWSGSWTALSEAQASGSASVSAPSSTANSGSNNSTTAAGSDGGLSTGAKAGIGAGVGVVGAAALGFLAFFLVRRRRAAASDASAAAAANSGKEGSSHMGSSSGGPGGPPHGYYEPVKDHPGSPGQHGTLTYSTADSTGGSYVSHNGGYVLAPQHGYSPQHQHQQLQHQYSAELPGQTNVPQELPAGYYPSHELSPDTTFSYTNTPHSPSAHPQ
ncbi:aspartic peptidase domain-containing protein [Xylariales sp. PMI_506]|nr:aspartic peptidase domain-containing protein [Xylariales sp. PMI_506]